MSGASRSQGAASVRRFKPYPAYKDSGVEWLGEIPAHWEVRRLKYVADEPIKNGIGEAGAYDDPEWPRYVRITDIASPRTLRDDTFKSLPPALAREAPFEVGDLLLAAVGATFGKSYLHTQDIGDACFAGYLVRFSPGPKVDAGFAAYWTESAAYWALVQSRVVQATIQNFSAARYRDLSLPLPIVSEQRAIAAFLDRETAKIDALVAKKERLIELLQEKRTALITRAVTRGLDPRAPLRDSGIPWLGKIPAHWELKRAKWLFRERDERSTIGEEVLLSLRMERGLVVHNEVSEKLTRAEELIGYKKTALNEIVLNRMRAASGLVAVSPQDGLVSPDYAVFQAELGVDPHYFTHLFKTELLQAVFRSESTGLGTGSSGFLRLYSESFLSLWLPYPPHSEQRAILKDIADETAKLDALRAANERTIALLKERRAALISAAVTGKIDVRGEAA